MTSADKISTIIRSNGNLLRFLIVGSFNTAVDLLLFFLVADVLGINVLAANIISTGITMLISFGLNHSFVFKSIKKRRETALQFFLATIFNIWLIQTLVIALILVAINHIAFFVTHKWTMNIFAKLGGIAVSFILNFLMYRYIFKTKEQEPMIL